MNGVLFDLDGVLIDTETTYCKHWAEMDRLYPTGIPDFAMYIKGTTLPEILQLFKDESVHADIERRLIEFQDSMEFPIYPGVEDFLKELKRRGIPAAIVTSSDKRKMEKLYAQHPGFSDYFDAIVDASMVTHSKPDPEPYLIGAKLLGLDPKDCFVFEDSMQGVRAGRASGAHVIGLTTTYPAERIAEFSDIVIPGLADFTVDKMLSLKNG